MPSFIKSKRDEMLWQRAKDIVAKQYNLTKEDGDKYYQLVAGIWKKMAHYKSQKDLADKSDILLDDSFNESSVTSPLLCLIYENTLF